MNTNFLNSYNLLCVGNSWSVVIHERNKVFFGQTHVKNKHSKLKWIGKFAKIWNSPIPPFRLPQLPIPTIRQLGLQEKFFQISDEHIK